MRRTATRRRRSARAVVGALFFVSAAYLVVARSALAGEAWATYRGNPQRTGTTDGGAGPSKPKVLWVLRSQEHFVASPVPAGGRVYVSGLGAFNVATFY